MQYLDLGIRLGIDLVAIFMLAYGLYYRRYQRSDLLLGYVALNIGLFAAMTVLTTVQLDFALGFGLFAILSIIRLRSSTISQQEVAYYFVSLVLALVNGLAIGDVRVVAGLNTLLILTMLVVDHRRLQAGMRRQMVTLDVIHNDEVSLVADLERRLGGRVLRHYVDQVDYVRDVMVVNVRFRADSPKSWLADPALTRQS